MGADLLRRELEKLDVREDNPVSSVINIWDVLDGWTFKHGEYVSQIIAGPKASAVIPLDDPIPFQEISHIIDFSVLYRECHQKRNCRSYINHSMIWNAIELPLPKGRRLDLLRPQIVLPRQLP